MKYNFLHIFYSNKRSINNLIYIFRLIDSKFISGSIILLLSMVLSGLCELIVLISLSHFISIVLINDTNNLPMQNNNLPGAQNFYSSIIEFISSYTSSDLISNCIVFITIAIFTLLIKLSTLKLGLNFTARLASFIEGKCSNSLMNVPYEYSKNLNCPIVITEFNHITRFTHGFIQNGIQSLSSLIVVLFIFYYLTTRVDIYFMLAFLSLILVYTIVFVSYRKQFKLLSSKRNIFEKLRTSTITYMVRMFRYIVIEKGRTNISNSYRKTAGGLYELNATSQYLIQYPKILIEYGAIILVSILIIIQASLYGGIKSIETTGVFLLAILRLLPSLQLIYLYLSKLKKDSYLIDSVYNLLKLPQEETIDKYIFNTDKSHQSIDVISSIELNNISFKYGNSDIYTIDDFSFKFTKGKSYALVGNSGSGKSTLIDIMLNLLHPQNGTLIINERYKIDTSYGDDLYTSILRYNTLLLGQNDFYSGDKIKDLLELNDEDLLNKNLMDKLSFGIKNLNLNTIFRTEYLDTFIGENGSKISGGQRQRLLILKAYLSNKRILIFDEATSALDDYSKSLVNNLLFSPDVLDHNRILIFSTHSDSVAKACDEKIYMKSLSRFDK